MIIFSLNRIISLAGRQAFAHCCELLQLAYNDIYWHNICQYKIPNNNKIIYINIFPYSFGLPVLQGEHFLSDLKKLTAVSESLSFQVKKLFCLKRKLSLQIILLSRTKRIRKFSKYNPNDPRSENGS